MTRIFSLALLLLSFSFSFAQTAQNLVDPESKDKMTARLEECILHEINLVRAAQMTDSLTLNDPIDSASDMQAYYMSQHFKVSPNGPHGTVGGRVKAVGGTKNAKELVGGVATFRGNTPISPEENAKIIVEKWMKNKKEKVILLDGTFVYAGVSARADKNYKKAYVSVVFGSFNTFNTGAKKRKELEKPYSKKQYKLKAADDYNCKSCEKFRDYYGLYEGVTVEDGKIFFEYPNARNLRKFIKRSKDGLAIDVVQRAQYEKADYNILDNNLVSKGILLKRVYAPTMYKKNMYIKDKKNKGIKFQLGTIPKGLKGPYELNLLVIQNGRVCKVLTKSYLEQGDQDSQTKLDMLLWPDSAAYFKPPYEPKAETNILTFKIPFEKNKFEYKPEDIQSFMETMKEPDFIVEGLYIYAYSSIEGDSTANATLQKKRGESVIGAVKKLQNKDLDATVITNDSWDLFMLDMDGTKWEYLTAMKKRDAIKEINTKNLAPQMEDHLSQQRFAQIVMDVTYDISGMKEQKFCIYQFNKAMAKQDIRQSLKIQYYMEKCLRNKKYTEDMHQTMVMPKDVKYLSVMMNEVVYRYFYHGRKVTDQDVIDMNYLTQLDPNNDYVNYNYLLCKVKTDTLLFKKEVIDETQKKIDKLYASKIPKKYVDALNIEFQFLVMDACDTIEAMQPMVLASIGRIKSFYNIKESTWQNALKFAYDLIRFHDFKYAVNVMDPFINTEKPDEQLLFAYASACAQLADKVKSKNFGIALQKAKEINPDRYCKLFGEPYLSFQVLDNPNVKKDHNAANCPK